MKEKQKIKQGVRSIKENIACFEKDRINIECKEKNRRLDKK